MKPLNQLIRPNILNLEPYTCARNEYTGEARAWLDANENSRIDGFNRYPDPLQIEVKTKLGAMRGVDVDRIFLGVGSDECVDITYRVFCRPGMDNVVAIEPTYGMYSVCAAINDVEYRNVRLRDDFSLDVEALFGAVDGNTKVIWICSPNNPTGNAFPMDVLREVASRFDGIVVVDEAYVDFSDAGSMVDVLDEYPNLIVMQTFSKAWASAALRLGIAFASREIISVFNNVKYPYNINILTQRQALSVLESADVIRKVVEELVAARGKLGERLSALECVRRVHPSDANFLLVEVTDAGALYEFLKSCGVIVRNRSRVALCGNCLRITVGTDEENDLLIEKMTEYGN
ncbi:histidinol-phosphate transaminase [uncultured Muribaculum sp.]|uniref:histidinol-phosphate transaminase n=1 Tax=uncultured Muribaculum sp. TaxID=1918613 RepID=UPI002599C442|nr:histidinol-phosphate transaminase [uncultured Muribaculum sp.]